MKQVDNKNKKTQLNKTETNYFLQKYNDYKAKILPISLPSYIAQVQPSDEPFLLPSLLNLCIMADTLHTTLFLIL